VILSFQVALALECQTAGGQFKQEVHAQARSTNAGTAAEH